MRLDLNSQSFRNADEKALRILPTIKLRPQPQPDCFRAVVVGSNGRRYKVWIYSSLEFGIGCGCECAAGDKHLLCYHVAAVWAFYQTLVRNGCVPDFLADISQFRGNASAFPFFYALSRLFRVSFFFSFNAPRSLVGCDFSAMPRLRSLCSSQVLLLAQSFPLCSS